MMKKPGLMIKADPGLALSSKNITTVCGNISMPQFPTKEKVLQVWQFANIWSLSGRSQALASQDLLNYSLC